jgi:hypothetical protein
MKANIRRRKNKIEAIKDLQGQIHYDKDQIEQVFIDHFQALFTTQATHNMEDTVAVVKDKINEEMFLILNEKFTKEEVVQAIWDMKALAASGPGGLPAMFFHNYWDIIGNDITSMALEILNSNRDPTSLNSTHICLIPKNPNPNTPSDYRPISLCSVTLKIITKTLANRIKKILPNLISPNHSAFIQGMLIIDNTIIAYVIFNYLTHTNRKNGFVGIKTDMANAYD